MPISLPPPSAPSSSAAKPAATGSEAPADTNGTSATGEQGRFAALLASAAQRHPAKPEGDPQNPRGDHGLREERDTKDAKDAATPAPLLPTPVMAWPTAAQLPFVPPGAVNDAAPSITPATPGKKVAAPVLRGMPMDGTPMAGADARATAAEVAAGGSPAPTPAPAADAHAATNAAHPASADGVWAEQGQANTPLHVAAAAPAPVATAAGAASLPPALRALASSAGSISAPDASANLAAAITGHGNAQSGDAASVRIDSPVASPQFASEVADKLANVISLRRESAELHLNPGHLGPVDIRISIERDQASVQVIAPHAATRDALEAALPMLRDLLANQGLALGQAAVGSGNAQGDPTAGNAPHGERSSAADSVPDSAPLVTSRSAALHLLDIFA